MKKYISPEIMVVAMDEEIMQGLNNTTGDGNQLGNNTLFDDMDDDLDNNFIKSKHLWDDDEAR